MSDIIVTPNVNMMEIEDEGGNIIKTFPQMEDYAEDENGNEVEVKHPIRAALKEVGKISKVEVTDKWEDDHCDCLNLIVTVGDKRYGVSFWWMTEEFYDVCQDASKGRKKALKELQEYIQEYI